MRPLAVLALVLVAVVSLVFAYVSISGTSEQRGSIAKNVVHPVDAAAAPRAASDLAPVEAAEVVVREEVAAPETITNLRGYANVLRGTVFNPGRTPVPNALVKIFREGPPDGLRGLAALLNPDSGEQKAMGQTRSDEQGRFEFKGLPPASQAMLVVEHKDFQRHEVGGIEIPEEGEIRVDAKLEEGFRVFGVVTSHDTGLPVLGATLVLDSPIAAQLPLSRPSPDRSIAKTDENGRYEFSHVSPGSRWLTCVAAGFATMIKNDVMIQSGTGADRYLSLDMRLHTGLTISGKVVGPNRKGVAGATLDAMSYNADALSRGSAVSDADGNFVIAGLAEAEYSVVARAAGFGEERRPRINAGITALEIELKELGGVTGRVIDKNSGRALSNFKVSARLVNQTGSFIGRSAQEKNVRGADNGSFHLAGLSPGLYVVLASADGYADTRSDSFTVGQGLTVPDVVVKMSEGGKLTGIVLNGYTNKPIAGAVVSTQENKWIDSPFTKALGGLMARTTTDAVARTDKDGRFVLNLLTPGEYQINVQHPEFTSNTMNDVQIFEGQEKDMGVLRVYTGARLMGQVFNGDGSRCVGANVSLHPTDGALSRNYEARTNSEGKYSFTNLAPGAYTVSAARPAKGDNPFGVIIDMKHTEVQIVLTDQRDYTQDFKLRNEN
jgi:protocatechuate 3,4-dioxygenase beta subunit